jgi:hypothetical protein
MHLLFGGRLASCLDSVSLKVSSTSCALPASARRHPLDELGKQRRPRHIHSRSCPAFTTHTQRRGGMFDDGRTKTALVSLGRAGGDDPVARHDYRRPDPRNCTPPRRPTIAPKPIFTRSNNARTTFSKRGGGSRPAANDKTTQVAANKRVPKNAVTNTNLNVLLIGGCASRVSTPCSTRASRPSSVSIHTYLFRRDDQTDVVRGFFTHSAAILVISEII